MRGALYAVIIFAGFLWGCDRSGEATNATVSAPQPAANEAPPAAEAQPPAAQPAAAAASEITCEAFVSKMIVLTAPQGADSFFTEETRGEWTTGCTRANDINQEPNATKARCILAANNLEESQACGETRFINRWMTLGGGGGGEGNNEGGAGEAQ